MIDLYYTPACNSCRSVLLTGKVLGIEFNLIEVDLGKGEHNKPEFVKVLLKVLYSLNLLNNDTSRLIPKNHYQPSSMEA